MIYVSLHSQFPSSVLTVLGIPHARDTVRVREGRVSDRKRWGGGGSSPVPEPEGIVRKCRDGEEVARHMYLWVGDTEIDQRGGEGIG